MPTSHPLTGDPDPESPRVCPYNPSHVLSMKRLQFHLVKCRKSNPNAKKETCPYNTTHLINEQEFKFHLEVCPDRKVIDAFTYITPQTEHVIKSLPAPVLPPTEENWDDEYCGTYEPAIGNAESMVTRTFIGGTKSERKKFRHEQRQRFRGLDDPTLEEPKFVPQPARKTHSSDDQPLRCVRTRPECVTKKLIQLAPNNQPSVSGLSDASGSIPKRASSGVTETSNNMKRKEFSGAAGTSQNGKPQGPSGIARTSNNRRLTAAERLIKNGPGPSRNNNDDDDDDDDSFVVFISKGRGHFKC